MNYMDPRFDFLKNAKEVAKAETVLEGDGIAGKAEFVEFEVGTGHQVYVKVELEGDSSKLTLGKHAVHIHEKGTCEGGFKCAGGHFDPGPSGDPDPDVNHPFHAGDLPNIVINENGKGIMECLTSRITLRPGPLCIFEPDAPEGTALMIHGNEDPYIGGEHGSGISGGPRIACGIINIL